MHCKFCQKCVKNVERHLCGKKYSYENIFKQILINILLDKEPVNVEDFFRCCVNFIKEKKLFQEVENPFNIMWECLKIFVDEYDCF